MKNKTNLITNFNCHTGYQVIKLCPSSISNFLSERLIRDQNEFIENNFFPFFNRRQFSVDKLLFYKRLNKKETDRSKPDLLVSPQTQFHTIFFVPKPFVHSLPRCFLLYTFLASPCQNKPCVYAKRGSISPSQSWSPKCDTPQTVYTVLWVGFAENAVF